VPVLSRVLGVATVGVGVLKLVKPDLYGQVAGLGAPSRSLRALHHSLGVRDVLSGLALSFAPAGEPLRMATQFRIVSDLADAVSFGLNAPTRAKKLKSAGVALGSAALSVLSLRWVD
jgi:hypothetical protein